MLTQIVTTKLESPSLSPATTRAWRPGQSFLTFSLDSDACFIDAIFAILNRLSPVIPHCQIRIAKIAGLTPISFFPRALLWREVSATHKNARCLRRHQLANCRRLFAEPLRVLGSAVKYRRRLEGLELALRCGGASLPEEGFTLVIAERMKR